LVADKFWQRHPGLVWSNPGADESVHIRAALLRPTFTRLLDVVLEFGLERIKIEWAKLQPDQTKEAKRAAPVVARIFANIEKGFALAASRN
jgi:hypothetical protein